MIPVKRWCDVPTPSTLPILHTHTRALTEMARLPEFSVQVMGMCVGLAWHAGGNAWGCVTCTIVFFYTSMGNVDKYCCRDPTCSGPVTPAFATYPQTIQQSAFSNKNGHKRVSALSFLKQKWSWWMWNLKPYPSVDSEKYSGSFLKFNFLNFYLKTYWNVNSFYIGCWICSWFESVQRWQLL